VPRRHMSHCTDFRAWRQFVDKERDGQMLRQIPEMTGDMSNHVYMANPYNVNRFFARGMAHMSYNDSAQTRMLLAPNTSDPLRSRAHQTHMVATRDGLGCQNGPTSSHPVMSVLRDYVMHPPEARPAPGIDFELEKILADGDGNSSGSHRERAVQWRLTTASEIPSTANSGRKYSSLSARGAQPPAQDFSRRDLLGSACSRSSGASSARSSRGPAEEDASQRGSSRTANFGKMLIPVL